MEIMVKKVNMMVGGPSWDEFITQSALINKNVYDASGDYVGRTLRVE